MLLEFENKLAFFIKAHDLFGSVSKIVLAVSGGADSTALLYAIHALKVENILKAQFLCAHINHQLRGAEADSDEEFVVAQASGLKLHVVTERVDVRGFARDHKLSIETAARQLRIKALMDIAKANHCERIATAHQKNDNAETVLHRLARGTGFRGLGGIWPKWIFAEGVTLIRPMLCVTREEVIGYLQLRKITWRQDRTNADCTYRRNFIRHRLLPELQRDCSGSLVDTLSELTESARRFYEKVCRRADDVWPSLAECTAQTTTLDLKKFQSESSSVRIELIRRSLNRLGSGQKDMTQRHYERIVQLAGQKITGKRIELPGGFVVQRDYGNMIFAQNRVVHCRMGIRPPVELKVPGKTTFGKYRIEATICTVEQDTFMTMGGSLKRSLGMANLTFSIPKGFAFEAATRESLADSTPHNKRRLLERFDLEKVKLPLCVRFRRAGDRFVPLGLDGEKKIGKFLTAQRIPQDVRRKVVLVEDREKIIWVWPIRISEQVKVTSGTRQILQLQITLSGSY